MTFTSGVVIFTGCPNSWDTEVAEEPRLMFIISPIASISISDSNPASFDPNKITLFTNFY